MKLHTVLTGFVMCVASATSAQTPAMAPGGFPRPLAGLPRTHKPEPTTAAIDVRDLMTRDYIIGDDSMQGRETGSHGGVMATTYIASELKRLGVLPGGENGTYFQSVPFTIHRPDSVSALRAGGSSFHLFTDFLIVPRVGLSAALGGLPYGGHFSGDDVETIWGGRIGSTLIDPAKVRGRIVVFGTAGGPWQFWRGGENLVRFAGARAIIVDLGAAALPATGALRNAQLFYNDSTLQAIPVIIATSSLSAQLFGPDTIRATGLAGKPLSGQWRYIDTPTDAPTRNVVGVIRGSDPKLRGEYVSIGAHSDHVGFDPQGALDHDSIRAFNSIVRPRGADDRPPANVTDVQRARIRSLTDSLHTVHGGTRRDSIANGADDDGSGTVLALELAESFALSKIKPKRSLLFVWHAAEEKGLYGAEFFTDHPTVPRDSIVTQINMDQMGRGGPEDAPPGGEDALVVLGARRLSSELGTLAENVNRRPGYGFKLDYSFDAPGDPSSGWCRSDHYMYARYSIPVLFFVSAVWYIDYHMVSDEPQYLDYPRFAKVGNYIRDVVADVANLDHKPALDHEKTPPDGKCVQ